MEKTMRLIHEETIKRISKKNQEGGIETMKESTTEAREILNDFYAKHGETVTAMREALKQMLVTGDGDSLLLYSQELKGQWEIIMEHIAKAPKMVLKDGLELDDVLTMKVKS